MVTMIRNQVRLHRRDFFLCAALMTGVFLVAELVIAAVMLLRKPNDSILVMSGVLGVLAAGLVVLYTNMNFSTRFTLSLTFSQTRRAALLGTLGFSALEGLLCTGLALGFSWVERHLCTRLWQVLAGKSDLFIQQGLEMPQGDPSSFLMVRDFSFLDWRVIPLVVAGCLGIGVVMGAVVQRFGNRGMWCYVALAWAPLLLSSLGVNINNPLLLGAAAAVAVVLGGGWAIWSLLHATVRI